MHVIGCALIEGKEKVDSQREVGKLVGGLCLEMNFLSEWSRILEFQVGPDCFFHATTESIGFAPPGPILQGPHTDQTFRIPIKANATNKFL